MHCGVRVKRNRQPSIHIFCNISAHPSIVLRPDDSNDDASAIGLPSSVDDVASATEAEDRA
jgi:hypothetical protein